jgi:hypothetical protein
LQAHVGERVLAVANVDPWIRSKMIEDGCRIMPHHFMRLLPVDVAAQVFEQAFEGRGRFPMLTFAKGFRNILAEDDRRRFKLTQRYVIPAPEADDIRNAALKAVQGMHDRHRKRAFNLTGPYLQDQFDCRFFQGRRFDAKDKRQEIDLDLPPIDHSLDNRGLRRRVVWLGNAQTSADRGCELFRSCTKAEIVDVLGGIGAILAQLGDTAVPFGPDVERLPSDDESIILKLEDGGQIIDNPVLKAFLDFAAARFSLPPLRG